MRRVNLPSTQFFYTKPPCLSNSISRMLWLGIFLCLAFLYSSFCLAEPAADNANKLIAYLMQEKTNLTVANNNINILLEQEALEQENLTQRKKQNKAMTLLIQAKIDSLETFLMNNRKQQQNYSYRLKNLSQANNEKSDGMELQEKINKINLLMDINSKATELISENLSLARRYQTALQDESRQMEVWQAKIAEQKRLHDIQSKIDVLEQERESLYGNNVVMQQEQKPDATFSTTFVAEEKLLLNNQAIILIQYNITELEIQKKLFNADYQLIRNQDVKTLQSVTDTYRTSINQLAAMVSPLKKMVELAKNQQTLLAGNSLREKFVHIEKTAALRLQQILVQQKSLQKNLEIKQQQLKKQLSIRQSLVEYHLDSWPSILSQMGQIPAKFFNYMKALFFKVWDHYIWQGFWPLLFYWMSVVFIFVAGISFHYILKKAIRDKERSRISAHLYDGILILLYRNITHLALLAVVITTFFLNHIAFTNYQLLVNLLLVWLAFRSFIQVARLALLERVSDSSGEDVKLYYRLKWLLLIGGWTTALMLFSRQLPLQMLLQDVFSRLFMLFLLAISLVVWKSKDVIPSLLRPILITKKRYFQHAISILAMLVPLTLLTTAVIGLIGYINLAWTMSRYQAYLSLLITAYILLRGLIIDVLELLSEWMISSLNNGWLWIEVILKPLDKILRVLLILASIFVLFQLFGWYADTFIMGTLQQFENHPLVDISGIHITLMSILKFLLLLCILIWVAKWTREFSYRWIYRNTRDIGIRHSLSVFTQYAVVLLGGFITLRVLGLDFAGMSVVLGGLAVGMGFGLRDFASNIVGGIMLLIERPVREGDLITLGEYEGRVAHIGIRSMRVSSWDNMEVLIPNAETFNKPFTNWTHQDSVIRTVVPIKVSRADDPIVVQQLIFDVLSIIPEILTEPPAQVLLKKIDDALIELEIRYFINVQLYTRFEIRSKVLFAIMAQFKAAGIHAPIPPLHVELKEGNQDDPRKNATTE